MGKSNLSQIENPFYLAWNEEGSANLCSAVPCLSIEQGTTCAPPSLLQPLLVPDFAWTHISMDFVEGLPKSEHKDMILVVVDRFTKYAHFVAMRHPITVKTVAQTFTDNIFRLHGLPTVIVTDRDRIFTSHLW